MESAQSTECSYRSTLDVLTCNSATKRSRALTEEKTSDDKHAYHHCQYHDHDEVDERDSKNSGNRIQSC